ncbi:MAG TPA: DUF4190 domain-containing protein [Micromonospora sp.]|nr:DUF4190 domain-containing protein [Micromonospora sp.]
MTYPQQPENWNDPNWPSQPGAYQDPSNPASGQPTGAEGYPPPAYPGYPAYGYPVAVPPPTNGLAIAALVCSIAGTATCITAPVGAILGHVARRQIRERGEGGEGLALAGIIIGWILTGLMGLFIAFYVFMVLLAIGASQQ